VKGRRGREGRGAREGRIEGSIPQIKFYDHSTGVKYRINKTRFSILIIWLD
jgi:hypothetical protein